MSAALSFFIGTVVGTLAALLFAAARERRLCRRHEASLQKYRDLFSRLLSQYIELRAAAAGVLKSREQEDPADWWRRER